MIHLRTLAFIVFLFLTIGSCAKENSSIEFFVSNNTSEIQVDEAYSHLVSEFQEELENTVIKVLQQSHIEQGKLKNILGMYQKASSHVASAENAEL